MRVSEVLEIVRGLTDAGATVWIDGGWCVDALVGRQLRDHADLDIAIDRADEAALRRWLAAAGYARDAARSETDFNFVYTHPAGGAVDIHVFAFDENGHHTYGVEYPADSLTGEATLGDQIVRCISPEWMFRFKTAYEPAPKDLIDVQALADRFGFTVPASHRLV